MLEVRKSTNHPHHSSFTRGIVHPCLYALNEAHLSNQGRLPTLPARLALELWRASRGIGARGLDVLREGGEEAVPQHAQVRELVPRGHELAALKMAKSPVYSLAPLPV